MGSVESGVNMLLNPLSRLLLRLWGAIERRPSGVADKV